jgi:triphosphoribosyl-dephospho-CoA synthetase
MLWREGIYYLAKYNVQSTFVIMKEPKRISVEQFASTQLNRRGNPMTHSYIYRLIREHMKGINKRELWFNYEFTGKSDRIYILI